MNRKRVYWQQVLLCVAMLMVWSRVAAAEAEKTEKQERFLRFVDDNDGGGSLQTSIETYKNADGVTVHLVSAVHVADHKYYADLAKTFAGYDVLLYEMVKPKDVAVPGPGAHSDSVISMIQRTLKDVLELDFQLDAIDYSAPNFVHADLDAETFAQMQADRGESMFTLMLQQLMAEMSRQMSKPDDASDQISMTELLVALTSPDRARHFKLLLGRQFEDLEDKLAGLDGPNGSVLVTERNKAAIGAMKSQMALGKKNMGIFYGAAHMKDMSARLEDMGFKLTGTEWRVAWDMTPKEGDIIVKTVHKAPAPAQP